MKNSSNVAAEAIVAVTVTILLLSIMQWLSKSLTMNELFTGEQMMFMILGASSSPFLWHLMKKVTPYVIERIVARRAGMKIRTVTQLAETSDIEPKAESQMPLEKSANELQAGLLSQLSEFQEKSQEMELSYGHEVGEEEEKPVSNVETNMPPIASDSVILESQQVNENYSLQFTEEELRELRDLTKRIHKLRRMLSYT